MNAKPFLYILCVAWAISPLAALGQQTRTSGTVAGQGPASKATVASRAPASAAAAASNATTATKNSQPAARVAANNYSSATTAAMPHPGYPTEPEFPHEYSEFVGQESCYDGSCHPGFGHWNSWICVPPLAHWGSIEYLLWWRKGEPLPPLASTGDPNVGDIEIVFGDEDADFGPQSGGRLTLGTWLDNQECFGVGGRFWALDEGRVGFQQTVEQGSTLGVPFINAENGQQNVSFVGLMLGGTLDITTNSEVYGGDVLFRKRCECSYEGRLDFVFGYQFSRLNEFIGIQAITNVAPLPNTVTLFDRFDARNEFHGGVLGFQAELDRGPFILGFLGKVGLGNMKETVTIAGGGSNPATGLQGILAQTSNIGTHAQETFAVVPEINMNVGYRVAEHVELTFGYSMLYWSHVLRPGDAIDPVVDPMPNAAPITNRPEFKFNSTDFWVMGINFGCQWSY